MLNESTHKTEEKVLHRVDRRGRKVIIRRKKSPKEEVSKLNFDLNEETTQYDENVREVIENKEKIPDNGPVVEKKKYNFTLELDKLSHENKQGNGPRLR
jgi:hypothetical protein